MDTRSWRPTSLAVRTAFFTASASPVTAAITSLEWLVPRSGVVRHHKADGSRRTAEESEGTAHRCVEGEMKSFVRARGVGEFQMPGLADIELSGVFLNIFQRDLNRSSHIGDIIPANHDKTSVTAPAFCISGKFNGDDLCIGGLYRLVRGVDLSGGTGS